MQATISVSKENTGAAFYMLRYTISTQFEQTNSVSVASVQS